MNLNNINTMKKIFVLFLFVVLSQISWSQSKPEHKIVFQMASSDTLVHKAMMKQLGNILTLSPTAQLEVVCHGPGLNMLLEKSSIVSSKIAEYSAKGVSFMACQFSIKERKVAKEELNLNTIIVPGGILEIVQKQEQGWSYIKAGK
jgi:intracellular sulfur oxidation DsrE/DsrF family protein